MEIFLGKEETKAFVLDNDLDKEYSKAHKLAFKTASFDPLQAFFNAYGEKVYQTCAGFKNARFKRFQRCRDKIGSLVLSGDAYFITLTFKNSVLASTSEETRRRYVSRMLKRVAPFYVGNIDFGDKKKNPDSNEREHYHAIIGCYSIPDFGHWEKNYGFVKVKKIGKDEKDLKAVAKYTAKLSSHALKASTSKDKIKAPRLIYSRTCAI